MNVTFAQRSNVDLQDIYAYHFDRNPTYARRLIDELIDIALSLSKLPERGAPQPNALGLSLRRLVEKNHLIVYAVGDGEVTILRFAYGARDIDALLSGET